MHYLEPRLVICYICGESGHYSNKCTQRIACAPQKVRMVNRGHLNHVVLEEAQKAPNVVLGTLRVNLAPASVLFDSGASHSYISSQFAVMQHVPFEKMLSPLVIHVPGPIFQSSQCCVGVRIEIGGLVFLATLVIVDSTNIDVTLGMDWLSTHRAMIDCAVKYVTFTSNNRPIAARLPVANNCFC